jgi:flagellar hook-length control protein FliK
MPLCLSLPTPKGAATQAEPAGSDVPTDAFAALLAAMGAGVVPTTLPTQLQPETPPTAWATTTQRGALPGLPTQPASDLSAVRRPAGGHVLPLETPGAVPAAHAIAASVAPVVRAAPGLPSTPLTPAAAATPATPAAPATPGVRAMPVTPATPAVPAAPGTPAQHPHQRARADNEPLDPLVPQQPDRPGATPAPTAPTSTAAPLTPAAEPLTSTHHVQPRLIEAARGLRHEGGGRVSLVVRLDPPELGAVLVRLTVQDGRVDVQLRTPDLAARSDLQARSFDVQQILREQGLDLTSFDVAHGDVFPGDSGQTGTPDRGTPRRPQHADGASHVTDDVPDPQPAGTWL